MFHLEKMEEEMRSLVEKNTALNNIINYY